MCSYSLDFTNLGAMIVVMQAKAWKRIGLIVAAALVAAPLAACGSSNDSSSSGSTGGSGSGGSGGTLTLGYFPNLTHGSAIIGVQKGYFKDALAKDNGTLKTQIFDSGSDTLEALAGGSLDATYIGPSPAITAYAQSHGDLVRIVSGATEGGAALVTSKSITSVDQLKGATLATPSAGNTQDVALKYFLKTKGFQETSDGGGDVKIVNEDNGTALQDFAQGNIQGAWIPEPYASQMVAEGGHVLINEKTLWPQGKYVTTVLLVRKDYMAEHADLVNDLLKGQIQANDYINANSSAAEKQVGAWLANYSQSKIPTPVLNSAWGNLTFTNDPIADSFIANEKHAVAVGLLDPVDNLGAIFDLGPLNTLLKADNQPTVSGPSVQ